MSTESPARSESGGEVPPIDVGTRVVMGPGNRWQGVGTVSRMHDNGTTCAIKWDSGRFDRSIKLSELIVKRGGTPGRPTSSPGTDTPSSKTGAEEPKFSAKSPMIPKLDLKSSVGPSSPEIVQARPEGAPPAGPQRSSDDGDRASGAEANKGSRGTGKGKGPSLSLILLGGAVLVAAGAAVAVYQSPELRKKAEALIEQAQQEVKKLTQK